MTPKKIAKLIVFILALSSLCVPLFTWFMNPELTQMQIFINTWFWPVYGFVILLAGNAFIAVSMKNE